MSVASLDAAGEASDQSNRLYELVRVAGRPYFRLVAVDGKPPDRDQLIREQKREAGFRRETAEGRTPEADSPEDDDDENIRFDEDLVSRYDARLVGRELVAGREAWLFEYRPKPEPPPERRRVDALLNRSRGRIWFDVETHEVARLEFELAERVRFYWFLGSVTELSGYYVRRPVDGVWLPREGEMTIESRRLFTSSRKRHRAAWSDYRPFESAAGS
jgi:hypothetical protein